MSDKVRQMTNRVVLSGKVSELEVRKGETGKNIPYISVKGAIQFGDSKAQTKRFEKFVQKYRIKDDGSYKENKVYHRILEWADNAKSVASLKDGESATKVTMQGAFATNDYVNKEEKLIEGLKIEAAFFNDFDEEYKGYADIEGYIQSIKPEIKGEDQNETGRLRVTLLTNDFFGNIIPVKNLIVPKELSNDFEAAYEVGQTAKLFVDFILHEGDAKPKKSGGFGVQRITEGTSYVEMIVSGADPAIDEDEAQAFSKEAVKIGLAERKVALDKLIEKGYLGSTGNKSFGAVVSNRKPPIVDDDDLLF